MNEDFTSGVVEGGCCERPTAQKIHGYIQQRCTGGNLVYSRPLCLSYVCTRFSVDKICSEHCPATQISCLGATSVVAWSRHRKRRSRNCLHRHRILPRLPAPLTTRRHRPTVCAQVCACSCNQTCLHPRSAGRRPCVTWTRTCSPCRQSYQPSAHLMIQRQGARHAPRGPRSPEDVSLSPTLHRGCLQQLRMHITRSRMSSSPCRKPCGIASKFKPCSKGSQLGAHCPNLGSARKDPMTRSRGLCDGEYSYVE